jgi:hypothetical protein
MLWTVWSADKFMRRGRGGEIGRALGGEVMRAQASQWVE